MPSAADHWSVQRRLGHAAACACDFLPVIDLWFRPLYLFVIIELASRRIVHLGVTGSRRRWRWRHPGWTIHDRKLLKVVEQRVLSCPADFASFLPSNLTEPFATQDLASASGQPVYLAQKITYCLRRMGTTGAVGKRGHAILYARAK